MAFPTTRDELNLVIAEQVRAAFPEKQIEDIGKLAGFFPVWDRLYAGYTEFTTEFSNLKVELETIRSQLNATMPQLREGISKGISDLDARASSGNAKTLLSLKNNIR